MLLNLTRPEMSLVLRAPLARRAGGLGMSKPGAKAGDDEAKVVEVFADTADKDYAKLLAGTVKAKARLDAIKRFDMPGFRPNAHYIREMKRYGVLPAELGDADPIDVYATDQAYWRSLWYSPPAASRLEAPGINPRAAGSR